MPGEEDVDPFINVVIGEDEVGAVIRAHLHIEHHLMNLIDLVLPASRYVRNAKFEYHQLVQLALATGAIEKRYARPLKAMREFRNKFAHQLDTKITKEHINNLVKTLSASDKKLMNEVYQKTVKEAFQEHPTLIKQLEPKKKFTVFAVMIRAALLDRENQLRMP